MATSTTPFIFYFAKYEPNSPPEDLEILLIGNRKKSAHVILEFVLLLFLAVASALSSIVSYRWLRARVHAGLQESNMETSRLIKRLTLANTTAASCELIGALVFSIALLMGADPSESLRRIVLLVSLMLGSMRSLTRTGMHGYRIAKSSRILLSWHQASGSQTFGVPTTCAEIDWRRF